MATRAAVVVVLVLAAVLQWTSATLTIQDCDYTVTVSTSILRIVCSRRNFQNKDVVQMYPGNNRMFIVCSDVRVGCAGTCPNNRVFDISSKDCGPAQLPCPVPTGGDPRSVRTLRIPDPCLAGSKYCTYFKYPGDKKKFVICDRITSRKEGTCLTGMVFNEALHICQNERILPRCVSGQTYCKPIPSNTTMISAHSLYFGCSDDVTKFIQCTRDGRQYVKTCQPNTIWCDDILACCRAGTG